MRMFYFSSSFFFISLSLMLLLPTTSGHGFGHQVPHFDTLSYGYTANELENYIAITDAEQGVMIQEREVNGDDCFCRVPQPSSVIPSCPSDDRSETFTFPPSTGRGSSSSSDY
eukprot:GFUD01088551.1.p1 GENE.GFUD01088551.1~~GFUD01088551.1.p1  ORF type:complete len:113 (+),score=23.41 GFUD01088551.1:75-413(+)